MFKSRLLGVVISIVEFVAVCSEDAVGGLPQKPEQVWVNIMEVDNRQYYVHWQVPKNPQATGTALNVSYTVRFHANSCNGKGVDAIHSCQLTIQHHDVNFDKFQCKVQSDALTNHLNKYCNYNVSVIANTSVGQVESAAVFVKFPVIPTPLPPLNFEVNATENQQIKVRWKEREDWSSYDVLYYITYYADGENSSKVVSPGISQQHITLYKKDGIEAFKTYHFYLRASIKHSSSETIGPMIVSTPEGEPSPPPTIVNATSRTLDNTFFRNVTIEWKDPGERAWLGKPDSFQVYYLPYQQVSTENATVIDMSLNYTLLIVRDTSLNNTVIPGLQSGQNYHVFMKMCNTRKCSVPGEGFLIKALPNNKVSPGDAQNLTLIVTVSVLIPVLVIVVIAIGVYIFYCKRSDQKPRPPPLNKFEVEPNGASYNYIQTNISNNEYHHLRDQEQAELI